jgi:DNA-binding response OmpR family regulator
MTTYKILYVEDDADLAFLTKEVLEEEGYEVIHYVNGADALHNFNKIDFDICLLDVMIPKLDGFTLATKIRANNKQIPIIFLTAKSLTDDKLHGLEIGGDDYITKPFEIQELLLKIKIFLKRKHIVDDKKNVIKIRDYVFDPRNLILSLNEEKYTLTQRESDLLELLYQNKNEVIKREIILERLWGRNDYFLGRSMDVFISRLRKFFKADPSIGIENLHGIGFRFYF